MNAATAGSRRLHTVYECDLTSPTMLPAGSEKWAYVTMPGTSVGGSTVFPPAASTCLSTSSMSGTSA